jgi:hypothetical protein
MDCRDQARRPRRIVVPGPLAPFADGLRQDLAGQGYALDTVTGHVHLLADLSGWLAGRGLAAADLTGEAAGEFLGARRAAGHRCGVTAQALAPVLRYLRGVQAVPAQEQPVPASPLEELLAVYRQYLEGERGSVGQHDQALPAVCASVLVRVPRVAHPDLAGAVGRAGHRPCAGAGQAPAGGRAGHGPAARAAVLASLPARGRAYPASAG